MRYILIFSFFFISCSTPEVKWKKGWGDNPKVNTKKIEKKIDDILEDDPRKNWARGYYHKTNFEIIEPVLVETKEDLELICKSEEKQALDSYQGQSLNKIPFQMRQVTFKKGPFAKKVYISKGACRELALYKSSSVPNSKQIRKKIQKVVLSYIYNEGTYLKSLIFQTPFEGVKFIVE